MNMRVVLALWAASAAWPALSAPFGVPLMPLRVHGESDLEPIEQVRNTDLYTYAEVVAHMEGTDGTSLCTGTRIGRDLFLTNFHCTQTLPCSKIVFRLGFEQAMPPEDQSIYACQQVLAKNLAYDYAVYQVAYRGTAAGGPAGVVRAPADYRVATLWTGDISVGEPLMAAGHPSGLPKEISYGDKCQLTTIVTEFIDHRQTIRHMCDTAGGSSGTPLMERANGHVVALHWGGRQGFNMAIPMALIVADLKHTLAPDDYAELQLLP